MFIRIYWRKEYFLIDDALLAEQQLTVFHHHTTVDALKLRSNTFNVTGEYDEGWVTGMKELGERLDIEVSADNDDHHRSLLRCRAFCQNASYLCHKQFAQYRLYGVQYP